MLLIAKTILAPNKRLFLLSFLLTLVFLGEGGVALAQTTPSSITSYAQGVTTILNPQNPGPNDVVTISLQSSLISLETSTIIWSVNGKVIQSGKDSRSFSLRLGGVGSKSVVDIYIKTDNFGTVTKSLTFTPTSVEILYEASSYTPPFYKGKALIPSEGLVTLFALPNFKTSDGTSPSPETLIYTWKKDGVVDGTNSGLGKNSYRFINGRLPEDGPTIEVSILDPKTNLQGIGSFVAKAVTPQILFYENNPLLGVLLNQALPRDYKLNRQEISLVAYPYYFGTKNRNSSNLIYTWDINDNPVKNTGTPSVLTIRSPGGKGYANVGLTIENKARILQTASNILNVSYGQ